MLNKKKIIAIKKYKDEYYFDLKDFTHLVDIKEVTHYQLEIIDGNIQLEFFKKLSIKNKK